MQTNQRATVATLLGLLLGFGLMQMGNTLQGTLLSIRGGIESFSPTQIGAVGAGFWVGIVIGSLRAGKVVQSVGHIRAFLAFGAVALTAPLLHLLVIDPIAWVVARALTGFCFAGLFIVVESWLNSAATDQTRGQILSVYAMTGLLAGIVGQLLLPTTDPTGFRPFCRGAGPRRRGRPDQPEGAVSAVALWTRGRLPVWGDRKRILHPRSSLRATAGP